MAMLSDKINPDLLKLERSVQQCSVRCNAVSASDVGWHIAHSLLVIQSVCKALQKSDPTKYKPKISFWKPIILITGYIPRGRVQAPERVRPQSVLNSLHLNEEIIKTREALLTLNQLPSNAYFEHPLFGHISLKTAMRFLQVHTRHHQKIIDDIIKAS